jgi:hypothetical protein
MTARPGLQALLPWDDESVERLDVPLRERVGDYWAGRTLAELRVADAFRQVASDLRALHVSPRVCELLDISIANEIHHAEICHELAARYFGRTLAPPLRPAPVQLPHFERAPPALRAALCMAGLCCINESVATVWLQQCLARSVAPLARAANHLHLRDETVHAQVGWAHLGSDHVDRELRRGIAEWLVPLLRANLERWFASATLTLGGVDAHGLPDPAEQREHVLGAVRNVVLPGFDHVGVDVSRAQRWFRGEFG